MLRNKSKKMAVFIGTKRVGRSNLSRSEARIAMKSPAARKIIKEKYVRTSRGKLALKPDPIGVATPKAYSILQDLAAGKGGSKSKKFATDALRQIQFIESTRTIPSRQQKQEVQRQIGRAITEAKAEKPRVSSVVQLDPKAPKPKAPTISGMIDLKKLKKEAQKIKPTFEQTGFEKRVTALREWERRAAERSEKREEKFRKVPGLGGESYLQRLGRDILAAPTRYTVDFGEQIMIIGGKTAAVVEGYINDKKRTTQVLVDNLKKTPKAVLESVNPKEPENLINNALLLIGFKRMAKARAQARADARAKAKAQAIAKTKLETKIAKPKAKPKVKDIKVQLSKNKIVRSLLLDWKNTIGQKVTGKVKQTFGKNGKGTVETTIKSPGQKTIRVKTRIKVTPLEKQRIKLRKEAKAARKIEKGLQVKAKRPAPVTIDGKKVYPFQNVRTGKVSYYKSRNQWIRAVKRQEKFLKTPEGKKLLKDQAKAKRQKQATKLEKERIRLRREAKAERKLAKGLMVKAERGTGVIRNGKKVYPFFDTATGKFRYFSSRKKWLSAVKQQLGKQKPVKVNLGEFFKDKIVINKVVMGQMVRIEILKPTFAPKKVPKPKKITIPKPKKPKPSDQVTKKGLVLLQEKKVKAKVKAKQIQKQKQAFKKLEVKRQKLKLELKSKQKAKPKTKSKQRVILKLKQQIEQIQKKQSKIKAKAKVEAKQEQKQKQKQLQEQKQKQKQKLKQKLKQKQLQEQKRKRKTKQLQKIKTQQKLKQKLKEKKVKKQLEKKKEEEKKKRKTEEYIKKRFGKRQFAYVADLAAILEGRVATAKERKAISKKQVFSGLERRPIV